MAKTVSIIPYAKPAERLKKVAAYARVSCGKDTMLHSMSAQVSNYSELIQSTPGWQYAGVYADEALSGTKTDRENFQQMIRDCRDGKIDMIITKSISRFARNTIVLLETVRELKELGVDVFFEEQNIHTLSSEGELMLTILASYAQEESLSNSENMKWRIRHGYERGELLQWRELFGYDIRKDGIFIVEDKAQIVRDIFQRVIDGESYTSIARDLNSRGIPTTRNGNWTPQQVLKLVGNEKYTGNALMQKKYVNNYLEKKTVENHGELPMYYIEDSHPAIIDMETYEQTQDEIKRRHEIYAKDRKPWELSPFSGKIRCMHCGTNYKRITANGHTSYMCGTFHQKGKAYCDQAKAIPEDTMMKVTAEVLGLEEFSLSVFRAKIDHIEVPAPNQLVFFFKDGHAEKKAWKDRSRRESWTPEMKETARQRALEQRRKQNENS